MDKNIGVGLSHVLYHINLHQKNKQNLNIRILSLNKNTFTGFSLFQNVFCVVTGVQGSSQNVWDQVEPRGGRNQGGEQSPKSIVLNPIWQRKDPIMENKEKNRRRWEHKGSTERSLKRAGGQVMSSRWVEWTRSPDDWQVNYEADCDSTEEEKVLKYRHLKVHSRPWCSVYSMKGVTSEESVEHPWMLSGSSVTLRDTTLCVLFSSSVMRSRVMWDQRILTRRSLLFCLQTHTHTHIWHTGLWNQDWTVWWGRWRLITSLELSFYSWMYVGWTEE